jgi:hypothetical protein
MADVAEQEEELLDYEEEEEAPSDAAGRELATSPLL